MKPAAPGTDVTAAARDAHNPATFAIECRPAAMEDIVIGVFDSGSGGLTILSELVATLPDRDFLYFGDHARAPYGTRPAEEVYAFTREAVAFLLERGCRLILIACNTAAAVALRRLQQGWLREQAPAARVLGVHVPLVEAITGSRWSDGPQRSGFRRARTVAVFATPRTVASHAFRTEIRRRAPEITVVEIACPGLAEAIEEGGDEAALQPLVTGYVDTLAEHPDAAAGFDFAALACTHYPFAAGAFRRALPTTTALLMQPAPVARALADYLRRHPGQDDPGRGRVRLLTSGDPAHLDGLLERLAPELRRFERVSGAL